MCRELRSEAEFKLTRESFWFVHIRDFWLKAQVALTVKKRELSALGERSGFMLLREKVPEGPSVFHVVAELVPCGTSPCMVFGCLSGLCECLEASLGLVQTASGPESLVLGSCK